MGKSSSSSQANQATTTNYTDKRLVNESGLVATEGSSVSAIYNVQSMDKDIVKNALDFATAADATNGEGLTHMLDSAENMFNRTSDSAENMFNRTSDSAENMFNRTTDTNASTFGSLLSTAERLFNKTTDTSTTLSSRFQDNVLDAYSRASADKAGGIDQKTMIVLGIAAAGALVLIQRKNG